MRGNVSILVRDLLGNANEEREEAGSLAALGMTSQKSKNNSQSRFPAGMTSQKNKGKSKNNSKGRVAQL